MSYTITDAGIVITETQDGITMPADYSFASVNDYVHGLHVQFEELQALCLGMSCYIEKLERVQQSEREACANLCECQATGHRDGFGLHLAALIRDRT